MQLFLVGRGIGRSPSPWMHEAALRSRGIAGSYLLRDVDEAELGDVVRSLRDGRFRGCNVTIPYKTALARACDVLEADANRLQVVNTIRVDGSRLIGTNTDALGFEKALRHQQLWPRAGAAGVVLGAGGAAAAVLLALSRVPMRTVRVVARRPEQAAAILHRIGCDGEVISWSHDALESHLGDADVIVNATPAPMTSLPFDVSQLPASCTVADVRYHPRPVDLMAAAAAAQRRACDGLEMLVQQAALSFHDWTGVDASAEVMRAAALAVLEP